MVSIKFTAEELAQGFPNPETIAKGKAAIDTLGFVVLEDVVDREHIRAIREKMLEELPQVLGRDDIPFNFTRSNIQQDPPPTAPYLFRDVLVNEFAIRMTESVLGKHPVNAFYSSNVALPNTPQRQPVHADIGHLWTNAEHATPAYALVVNIPLCDVGPWNGSTEIWPGTHLDTSVGMQEGDVKASEEQLAYWGAKYAPIQPEMKEGSILIRDIRMWHAGMPNPSNDPRIMLAMIHWVGWWRHGDPMLFAPEAKEILDHPRLFTNAKFVEGPIDYLHNHGAYDMQEATK